MTLQVGRSDISASAIAPEPVPTSCTRAPSGSSRSDLYQQLGLAARPEHALVDGDLEAAEGGAAEDVGHRLAVDPALDRSSICSRRLGGDLAGALDRELAGLHPERVGDQHFGVAAGVLDPGGGDPLGRVVEHRAHGASRGPLLTLYVNCRHYPPILPY